eukprot:GHVP01022011.1.p1 GENE.GHVP01022011.1~~GHVP01022011.1.p1  ORF type:complete len:559 (-),score=80.65 GHVP01022011.1:104-1753(-)
MNRILFSSNLRRRSEPVACFVREQGFAFNSWSPAVIVVEGNVLKKYISNILAPVMTISLKGAVVQGPFSPDSNYQHSGSQYYSLVVHGKQPKSTIMSVAEQTNVPKHIHIGFKSLLSCVKFNSTLLSFLAAQEAFDPTLKLTPNLKYGELLVPENCYKNKVQGPLDDGPVSFLSYRLHPYLLIGVLKFVFGQYPQSQNTCSTQSHTIIQQVVNCNHTYVEADLYEIHILRKNEENNSVQKIVKSDLIKGNLCFVALIFNFFISLFSPRERFLLPQTVWLNLEAPDSVKLNTEVSQNGSFCAIRTSASTPKEIHENFVQKLNLCIKQSILLFNTAIPQFQNKKITVFTYDGDQIEKTLRAYHDKHDLHYSEPEFFPSSKLRFLFASDFNEKEAEDTLNLYSNLKNFWKKSYIEKMEETIGKFEKITIYVERIMEFHKRTLALDSNNWIPAILQQVEYAFSQNLLLQDNGELKYADRAIELEFDCAGFVLNQQAISFSCERLSIFLHGLRQLLKFLTLRISQLFPIYFSCWEKIILDVSFNADLRSSCSFC